MNTKQQHIDEQALANGCRDYDAVAQRQLYDQYVEYMMLTCLRYIPAREDAKEVMLDGFVNAYKNFDRFEYRGQGSLKAWLKKITVNQCLMHLRKRNNVLQYADEPDYANEPTTESDAMDRMSVKEIIQLIQQLPDGYRTVFNLYTFEDMTHQEISKMLGISENTSKSQLHKARALLQKTILKNRKIYNNG